MRTVAWTAAGAAAIWLLGLGIAKLEYRWKLWRMKRRIDRITRRPP